MTGFRFAPGGLCGILYSPAAFLPPRRHRMPSDSACPGPSRRAALAVGSLGAFGLTPPRLLAARESQPERRPKSCILLFLLGAPPQQETWDPKPDSPAEARGDMGVIR